MQRTQQPGDPASRRCPRLHGLVWPLRICNVGLNHARIGGLVRERVRRRVLPFGVDSLALMHNLMGLLSWSPLLFIAGLARRIPAIANRLPRNLRDGRGPTFLVSLLSVILIGVNGIGIERHPLFEAATIAGSSLVLTMVIDEFVVRRTAIQQNVFGLELLSDMSTRGSTEPFT